MFTDGQNRELLDFEGAAAYLGMPVSSVKWAYRMGRIPFIRLGKRLVTTADKLDAAIDSQFQKAAKR